MERQINEQQAEELALSFMGFIPDYIQSHKAAYLAYLKETGQSDENYKTEADK